MAFMWSPAQLQAPDNGGAVCAAGMQLSPAGLDPSWESL